MTKLDLRPQSPFPTLFPTPHTEFPKPASKNSAQRANGSLERHMIVLIPGADSDYSIVVRRVWELAKDLGMGVLFLGLCNDAAQEPSLRRQLVTLSALVGDGKVLTAVKVVLGKNWMEAVKSNWQEGDVLVCFKEQRTGFLNRPLGELLESNFKAPVYFLSDPDLLDRPRPNWLSQFILWSGSIGILVGFGWMQIKIDPVTKDWAYTTLLILSIFVEAWLIWVWNSLFS